jgi:hypothetical protein
MHWTHVMSAFVLKQFADLVGEGVKTAKGFKEVHVNAVVKQVSEFFGLDVTKTQVSKHLCKWRQSGLEFASLRT